MTRTPEWQSVMLAKPLKERIAFARHAREQSKEHGEASDMTIMDVNEQAVEEMLQESGAQVLLHGHTHRPDIHDVDLGDRDAQRIVLGDWYEQGSVLRWDENGPRLEFLPR
jgi:UDP-2,3-diacylglucosamine hydrolase